MSEEFNDGSQVDLVKPGPDAVAPKAEVPSDVVAKVEDLSGQSHAAVLSASAVDDGGEKMADAVRGTVELIDRVFDEASYALHNREFSNWAKDLEKEGIKLADVFARLDFQLKNRADGLFAKLQKIVHRMFHSAKNTPSYIRDVGDFPVIMGALPVELKSRLMESEVQPYSSPADAQKGPLIERIMAYAYKVVPELHLRGKAVDMLSVLNAINDGGGDISRVISQGEFTTLTDTILRKDGEKFRPQINALLQVYHRQQA